MTLGEMLRLQYDLDHPRRYENWEYGYPPDKELSESQRMVPPEMVKRAEARFLAAILPFSNHRPENV